MAAILQEYHVIRLFTTITSLLERDCCYNYKGDNEMITGAMHISPGICLTAEENRGNP